MSIKNGEAIEFVEVPVVDMLPIGHVPAEDIGPALELSQRIAELGILGVLIAVTPEQSGHKLAMPDWSHLSAGDGSGRVGFTAELADDAGINRTMSALNAVCELIRRTREAADGLEKVVQATLAGMSRLGVQVVDASGGAEEPAHAEPLGVVE